MLGMIPLLSILDNRLCGIQYFGFSYLCTSSRLASSTSLRVKPRRSRSIRSCCPGSIAPSFETVTFVSIPIESETRTLVSHIPFSQYRAANFSKTRKFSDGRRQRPASTKDLALGHVHRLHVHSCSRCSRKGFPIGIRVE